MGLYERSVFPISETLLPSIQFILKTGDELFVGLLSQNPAHQLIPNTPFFKRQKSKSNLALCALFYGNHPQMILTSGDGRDPAQHLYSFLQYNPQKLQTPMELDKTPFFFPPPLPL